MDSNPNTKGAIAEQAIVLAAIKLRVPVWRPVSEHGRADLVLDIGNRLWRVQVKWGRLNAARDVVVVSLRTSRCTPHGHVRRTYGEDEVELFAVYCGDLDRSFLLPVTQVAGKQYVHLRLKPARNGQQACINLADDFTFNGAVAQLARAPRWQRGGRGFESPQLHSKPKATAVAVAAESCRVAFGCWMDRVAAGQDAIVTRRGKPMTRLTAAVPDALPRLHTGATTPPGLTAPLLFPPPADAA
jgi:antitoxin (DNA-binding transcriptional repressor) of toxin-antitoxin stability system